MKMKKYYPVLKSRAELLFYYSSKNPIAVIERLQSVILRSVSCTAVHGTNVGTTTRK